MRSYICLSMSLFSLFLYSCTTTKVVTPEKYYTLDEKKQYLHENNLDTFIFPVVEFKSFESYARFQDKYGINLPTIWLFNEKGELLVNEKESNNCSGLLNDLDSFRYPSESIHLQDVLTYTTLETNFDKNKKLLVIHWSIMLNVNNKYIFKNLTKSKHKDVVLLNVDIPNPNQ